MLLQLYRHFGITVTGQVDQSACVIKAEENDLLGTSRCFAGTGKTLTSGNGVDRAGLAHVGASREGDLGTRVFHPVARVMGGAVVFGAPQQFGITGF